MVNCTSLTALTLNFTHGFGEFWRSPCKTRLHCQGRNPNPSHQTQNFTHTHTHTKVQRTRHPSQADENVCADSLTNKREDNVMETFTTPLQSETDQEETVDEHVKVRLQITIVCDCCVCSAEKKYARLKRERERERERSAISVQFSTWHQIRVCVCVCVCVCVSEREGSEI